MQTLKKTVVLLLFVSLIVSLVLFKSSFFENRNRDSPLTHHKPIKSNNQKVGFQWDDFLNDDMRLHITYQKIIALDTLALVAQKKIRKTYRLSKFSGFASGSKSIILHEEYLPIICKNEVLREELYALHIVRAGSKTGLSKLKVREADLKEVSKLVRSGDLSLVKKYSYYLKDEVNINSNWNILNDLVYVSCEEDLVNVIKPKEAHDFLKKYSTYGLDYIKTDSKNMSKSILSSSKSFVVVDPIITAAVLEENLRKQQKIKEDFIKLMTVE